MAHRRIPHRSPVELRALLETAKETVDAGGIRATMRFIDLSPNELEALLKDTERLDWFEEADFRVLCLEYYGPADGKTWRQTIDDEMAAERPRPTERDT